MPYIAHSISSGRADAGLDLLNLVGREARELRVLPDLSLHPVTCGSIRLSQHPVSVKSLCKGVEWVQMFVLLCVQEPRDGTSGTSCQAKLLGATHSGVSHATPAVRRASEGAL